jgi:hypothetical protein
MRRLRDLIPEHRPGTGFARQPGDDPDRGSLAQQQRRAQPLEAFLQGPERLRQPPARRAAQRTRGRRARCAACFVEDVNADHRRAGAGGAMQGGMIGKAEIVAKPDDAGRSSSTGHRDDNSDGAGWVQARTLQLCRPRYVLQGDARGRWSWSMFAVESTLGLLIANWIGPKI